MSESLTVDNLCAALRFFFKQIADNPDQPVDQKKGITLYGVPGDDAMRAVMEAFNGEVKITLREMPVAMNQTFSAELATGQGAVLWSPSEEPPEECQHVFEKDGIRYQCCVLCGDVGHNWDENDKPRATTRILRG